MPQTDLRFLIVIDFDETTETVLLGSPDASSVQSCSVDQFVDYIGLADQVLFAGSTNALSLLAKFRETEIIETVWVHSPHVCTLDSLQMVEAVGGARQCTPIDKLMLHGLDCTNKGLRSHSVAILRQLPLYPYLSFIEPRNEGVLADVVFTLFDPRMYVNPFKPDSSATFRRAIGADGPKGHSSRSRRLAAAAAWCVDGRHDLSNPRAFLMRSLTAQVKLPSVDTKLLRPHQRFAHYLRYAWLDSLRPKWYNEPLFLPEQFFPDEPETVEAFKSHMAAAR